MISSINVFINRMTGVRYWYRFKITYKSTEDSPQSLDVYSSFGLVDRRHIVDHKLMKKAIGPFHPDNDAFSNLKDYKHLLNNGVISIEPTCYLGRFKERK